VSDRGDALIAAIQGVLHDHSDDEYDRGIVTDYVACIEVMGADGEPYIRIMRNPRSTLWRSLGLFDAGLTQARYDLTVGD